VDGREPVVEQVLGHTDGEGADVVYEAAGNSVTTALALEVAAMAGVVVQVGWPEIALVPYSVETLLAKELDVRGINRYANAFPAALSLMGRGAIQAAEIITHRFPFDQAPQAFAFAHEHPEEAIKVIVEN
jgi:L-iditol 2-dehydrogenase